jgi:Fe2+ or Zn2+ uptake regulation protein
MKRAAEPGIPEAWLETLRARKIKVTPNRRRVLGRFLEADTPWTLQSLHRSLNLVDGCDLSSVYRALSALRTAGLLEEFRLPGKRETYFALLRNAGPRRGSAKARPHGHHHHILCQDCGRVSHLEICVPAGLMGKVEDASGFRVTEHHLEFKGVCGECR